MIQITKQLVESFKPCENRANNFYTEYPNYSGTLDSFLDLDKITYGDKIWVATKVLNKNQLVHFAILCAESVLYIFENNYPERKEVRACLEYLKTIKDFTNITPEQSEEILKHRRTATAATNATAYTAYAAYAANAATNAAAKAANAANAANAADYATDATAYAAYAANATNATNAATKARKQQEDLNLTFLKMAGSQ